MIAVDSRCLRSSSRVCLSLAGAAPIGRPSSSARRQGARAKRSATLHVFKGIPYALPPVGRAALEAAAAGADVEGHARRHEFGPACVQPKPRPGSIYAWDLPPMSEDCLSLNIWAPADAARRRCSSGSTAARSSAGSGSDALYDGTRLAERGVVVVSINYRLGVLGYLAHPALSAESRAATSPATTACSTRSRRCAG